MLPSTVGVIATATKPAPMRKSIKDLAPGDLLGVPALRQTARCAGSTLGKPTRPAQKRAMSPRWEGAWFLSRTVRVRRGRTAGNDLKQRAKHAHCKAVLWGGGGNRETAQEAKITGAKGVGESSSKSSQPQRVGQPLSALRFVVDFALGQSGDDCRAGDHGHECKSYQNVVHWNVPQQ